MTGDPGTAGRLDWTLLLPATEPVDRAVFDGGVDVSSHLTSVGLARSAEKIGPGSAPCPLVVARWPHSSRPSDLAAQVSDGGLLLVEIDRLGEADASPRAVERDLERAGLDIVSVHWTSPTLTSARRYLPIDSAEALRWHLRTLYVADTARTKAAELCLRVALALVPRLATAVVRMACRRYVVVARRGAAVSSPHGAQVVLTSGHDRSSRSVLVRFDDGSTVPQHVSKVAMDPESVRSTSMERARVQALHDRLPADLSAGVPVPLETTQMPQGLAFAETAAAGRTILTSSGAWGRPLRRAGDDLQRAVDWFTRFGLATQTRTTTAQPWTEVFGEARDSARLTDEATAMLDRFARAAPEKPVGRTAVHIHGDPGPWNIYLTPRSVSVIDWEVGIDGPVDPQGPPLIDVLYLVTYWYFLVSRVHGRCDEDDAFARLVRGLIGGPHQAEDRALATARRVVERSMRATGVSTADLPSLSAALWARQACDSRRRSQRWTSATEQPNAAERRLDALARITTGEEVTGRWPLRNAR